MYTGQGPDHQGVDQGDQEAVHPAHGEPRHRDPGDDGGRGEEEEQQAENRVGDTEVNKQQAARLPCLNKEKCSELLFINEDYLYIEEDLLSWGFGIGDLTSTYKSVTSIIDVSRFVFQTLRVFSWQLKSLTCTIKYSTSKEK